MMRPIKSYRALEELGRVRLSKSFFVRDMLYSEIANYHRIPNIPVYPGTLIAAGRHLCEELLEPLQDRFGRISIRSAYRSPTINALGNEKGHSCASNEKNYARHIWDHRDKNGHMGATATIVVNSYISHYEKTKDWQTMANYIHDNLPYSELCFYPKLCAFNIGWHERPKRQIRSYIHPVVSWWLFLGGSQTTPAIRQRCQLHLWRTGWVYQRLSYAPRSRCTLSSANTGQNRMLASDLEEPYPAGKLLSTGRPWTPN